MPDRGFGGAGDRRTPRIREAEQAPDLVERLAGGVVHGPAEVLVAEAAARDREERVAAGHDEGERRELRLLARGIRRVLEPRRVEVALEMVDPDERQLVDVREGLREVDPHEQRPGEAGPRRHGDRVDVRPAHPGVGPRLRQGGDDPPEMRTRRDLGNDPAGRRVERDLARDDRREDPPPVCDERDARLVAARLDREDEAPAHASPPSPGAGISSGSGSVATHARRRASRAAMAGSPNGGVVMTSASSPSSL